MGFFWADKQATAATLAKCPIDHHAKPDVSACPVMAGKGPAAAGLAAACPVKKDGSGSLNPMNNMPYEISSVRMPGQQIELPTARTMSTIPRGTDESDGVWEYPSPQQMFNAMMRKGKDEVPEDAVESMVDVHNFLNEGAWQVILEWEQKHTVETRVDPRLLRFTGRPHDLSPRAQAYGLLGKLFPEHFTREPPFDRHDWTVLRADGKGGWNEVRYVIDYYGGPDDPHGMPTFFLDVRPALDNFGNAFDRAAKYTLSYQHLWDKAMGKDL
ncbi:hypothetical protein BABINDRAFT_35919 [Babjeviella inositovora NRRL Y-12698]|uniref:Holocytochrome c-type synthase n=1 Tax=Babjeviella inositovora NRRL Y-12698 TaxID=984486 RepID=A0A1E3QRQ3_9ASCO|nr:uncharacterized protein BABINDRAFT_35919 [Babjeviella inositovora NRRL Y-12698]ODQ80379.1 hypothetical protein BABINDRAFT_35919 [Babjeviella inositovora NRRL Y-12698]